MAIEFYKIAEKINKLVKEYSMENLEAIEKCFEFKGAEYYFFTQKLPELKDPLPWLIPLKDKKYFAGEKNPPPQEVKEQPGSYTMPFWNVLLYLERVAKINKENPSKEITNGLVEIVDSIISYRDEDGKRIDNYRTDWFVTKIIFMLPYKIWNEGHIEFIGIAIRAPFGGSLIQSEISKSVLPALIENKAVGLILKLLEVILDFTKVADEKREKIKPVMEKHWLRDALKKFKKQIAELCGLEAAKIGITTIKKILKEEENEFSYVRIPTIEDSSQNQFPDRYECQLVFLVRDMFENLKPGEIRETVKEILAEKHSIFKRIAIHTINRHYDELKDLFWGWDDNPLNERGCKHEIFQLLKENSSSFTKEQINKVLEWVESKDYGDYDEERKEQALAYRKKEWLSTLLPTNNPDVISKYKGYDQKNPAKLEHAGSLIWHEGGFVEDVSPVEFSEIIKWPNEKIAEYLREYKEEKPEWGLRIVSVEGLVNCFRKCVSEHPEKFAADLGAFLSVPQVYQDELLRGFNTAWEAKEEFPVEKVFDYIEALLGSDEFWNQKYEDKQYNYRNGIISQITEFIEGGTKDDGHAFDAKYLPRIENILLALVQKAESRIRDTRRIVDTILVSPRANVFSALMQYSLRYARLSGKKEGNKWPPAVRDEFTKRIDRTVEDSLDFALTVVQYLPNLMYLDKEWLFANIERIFAIEDEERWKVVFGGCLEYSRSVYEEFYSFLREKGHYRKAIETEFEDTYIREKLVQHVAIGFLEGWEDVGNPESLIAVLLRKKNPEQLSELIGFLNTIKEGEPRKKLEERIKGLWGVLFGILEKEQDKKEYQAVISKLHLWLGIVDTIDDGIKEWAKLTAKYVGVNWNGDVMAEYLSRHVDKTPKNVGEIYIEMLKAGTYPDHKKEDIIKIVQSLYEHGEKKIADTICNIYGEVGLYFLRETYEGLYKRD